MQDLVRIGVADAAEQVRVGQRALDRVVLAGERIVELLERCLERLDAAGIERGKRRLTAHHLHRRALLRAGFREQQGAAREFE